jgi:Uma2 family endonuclease
MTALEPINVPHAPKLTVRDFLLLNDSGAFSDYAKSELIEGEIICTNAVYANHAKALFEIAFQLKLALIKADVNLTIFTPVSVDLGENSLPEPDIALCENHDVGPIPVEKIKLLIEVSDTTLEIDQGRKMRLYAKAGVPEYWVIDLNDKRALLHMLPEDGEYAEQIDVPFGEPLYAGTIDGLRVETGGLG